MKKLLILIGCVLLWGCPLYECFHVIDGIVIDKNTGKAVSNAAIQLGNTKSTSNINGMFEIGESACGKLNLNVSKNGYKPFEMNFSYSNGFKKYEINSTSKWFEYPAPFYHDSLNRNTFTTGTWIDQYSEDFQIKSDTVLIYLVIDDIQGEIDTIKKQLKENSKPR